jgi:hypothetical protein
LISGNDDDDDAVAADDEGDDDDDAVAADDEGDEDDEDDENDRGWMMWASLPLPFNGDEAAGESNGNACSSTTYVARWCGLV